MKEQNQQKLIEGLCNNDPKIIKQIYENNLDVIKRYILRNNGCIEDVHDTIQDAFLIIITKIKKNELKLNCCLSTFIFSVCKNLWLYNLRKKKNNKILFYDDLGNMERFLKPSHNGSEVDMEKQRNLFNKYFQKLNNDSKKIIKLKLENNSINEIAEKLGYEDSTIVSKRLYRIKKNFNFKYLKTLNIWIIKNFVFNKQVIIR